MPPRKKQYVALLYDSEGGNSTFMGVYKTIDEAIISKQDHLESFESNLDIEDETNIEELKRDYANSIGIEIVTDINPNKPIYIAMNGNYFMFARPYITNSIDEWKKIMKKDKQPEDYQIVNL